MAYRGVQTLPKNAELSSVRALREAMKEKGVKGMKWGQHQQSPDDEEKRPRGQMETQFWSQANSIKSDINTVAEQEKSLSLPNKFRLTMARSAMKAANAAYLSEDLERALKNQGKARQILDRISGKAKEPE